MYGQFYICISICVEYIYIYMVPPPQIRPLEPENTVIYSVFSSFWSLFQGVILVTFSGGDFGNFSKGAVPP